MGRLRKSKVDMIIKLRKEHYTQAETAEKVGVHLKTVQKYDPMRRPSKAAGTEHMPAEVLDRYLKAVGSWIDIIYYSLRDLQRNTELYIKCPKCNRGRLGYPPDREAYSCGICGHEEPFPTEIWDFGEE